MIELFAIPQICHLQPHIYRQQDGSPPHWSQIVRDHLDKEFSDRWIGRDGPILWPPLLLLVVYEGTGVCFACGSIEDLKVRISLVAQTVPQSMLANTWDELEYRLDVVRATNCAHIELW
ncbi:unnamed protein product [Larinioides sclopetarius]|uniref:Uncharacterized protein n=1 Tax=Larinioides sclopetarius TaxID=280406 RepID=A0AAV1YSC8_9ARAC